MTSTKKALALAAAVTASMLACATPAMAVQPAAQPAKAVQSQPLEWLSLDALTGGKLVTKVKDLLGKGYVPTTLNVTNAANPQYTSSWIKDTTRKVNVLQGLSVTDLPARIKEQVKAGYQPTLITGTGTGQNAVFGAIFEKTSQLVKSQLTMTKETLVKVNAELSAAGYSLASLDVYGTVEKPLYAAVWVAGGATGALQVTLGQTVEERGKELLTKAKQGLQPVLMAVEPGQLYTTVWGKVNGDQKELLGLSKLAHSIKAAKLKALGYQPEVLSSEDGVIASIWRKG
ncbi:hypothetical protein AB0I81_26150 [Nonomuraea sp. NPDC050404]|uniref:hypothetical protein n=1 Tax=Nonomuraea sp. NPDC050404 TaxID=3155783 RepID=UPI0033CEDA67